MHNFLSTTTVISVLLLGALHLPLQAESPSFAPPTLDVRVGASGLTATSADCTLRLQIAGPADFHVQQDSEEGSLSWYHPGSLVDGPYRYDVYATPKLSREELTTLKKADLEAIPTTRQSGRFRVEGGHLIVEPDPPGPSSHLPGFRTWLAALWDLLLPSAAAADLTVTDASPSVIFDDTDDGDAFDWYLQGTNDPGTTYDYWRLYDSTVVAGSIPLLIYGGYNNNRSLEVDSSGNLSLAHDAIFINRGSGRVNIGSTSETCCNLFVTGDSLAEIGLKSTSAGASTWQLEAQQNSLEINENNGAGIFGIENGAPMDSLWIGDNGFIGLGLQAPQEKLHVLDGNLRIEQTGSTHATLNFVANGNTWEIKNNQATGRLTFFSPGGGATTASFKFDRQAVENLLRVGVLGASIVDVNGDLVVTGTFSNPDYVFTPEYELESIEEHSAYMWEHQHLPAVGQGKVNTKGQAMVNVGHRSQGMLEELEKAHIYIEQLKSESNHKGQQIAALTQKVTTLEAKEAELEALKHEMASLKALFHQFMTKTRNATPGKEG